MSAWSGDKNASSIIPLNRYADFLNENAPVPLSPVEAIGRRVNTFKQFLVLLLQGHCSDCKRHKNVVWSS